MREVRGSRRSGNSKARPSVRVLGAHSGKSLREIHVHHPCEKGSDAYFGKGVQQKDSSGLIPAGRKVRHQRIPDF